MGSISESFEFEEGNEMCEIFVECLKKYNERVLQMQQVGDLIKLNSRIEKITS